METLPPPLPSPAFVFRGIHNESRHLRIMMTNRLESCSSGKRLVLVWTPVTNPQIGSDYKCYMAPCFLFWTSILRAVYTGLATGERSWLLCAQQITANPWVCTNASGLPDNRGPWAFDSIEKTKYEGLNPFVLHFHMAISILVY